MFKLKLSHFSQEVFTIHPGEYHVSGDDIIIATVLGSCVAVAFYDARRAIGGLNHFMLPGGPTKVPSDNIEFAQAYLECERIPVVASDLGGLRPRKVFFFVKSGKVLLKRFGGQAVLQLEQEGNAYLRIIKREQSGPVTIFGQA